MSRIVSVWLIDWPIAVWSNSAGRSSPPDGAPFALVERGTHGLTLHALNAAARAAGLRRGQRHADARAIVPRLVTAPAEPDREASMLAQLAGWCTRWSPSVAIDPSPDGFEGMFVDITGGAHLFGGEAALLREMRRKLARVGVGSRAAIADTPGAAWAAARFGTAGETIVAPGAQRDVLVSLPIAALRVDADTLKRARRFGLKTIGSLQAMPRSGLARRFRGGDALGLVRRLDQAMGVEPECLTLSRAIPRYRAREAYAEPILDMAGIEARLDGLCATLAAQLYDDAMGARALTLAAYRADGRVETLCVRLGLPSRTIAVWQRLLREKGLDRIDPGFGIDALTLAADLAEPLSPRQATLEGDDDKGEALAGLVDRLVARLGNEAVLRSMPFASWIPERSIRWESAQDAEDQPGVAPPNERPILLLDPPEPIEASFIDVPEGAPQQFTWRRAVRRVARSEGPERLSPEWWSKLKYGIAATRDYYRVEDQEGVRYWLFREGLYGRDNQHPGWWMHGLFA